LVNGVIAPPKSVLGWSVASVEIYGVMRWLADRRKYLGDGDQLGRARQHDTVGLDGTSQEAVGDEVLDDLVDDRQRSPKQPGEVVEACRRVSG